jgi:hypothetical protein
MNQKTTLAILLAGVATARVFATPTLWTGPNITFTKANGANPSLAPNQDRLTSTDWITRSSSQGLFNAHEEGGFSHFFSPSDTEWADGSLANYASLTYHDWNTWAKGVHGGPPTTIGVPAVVHLTSEDIYFSIKFTSWTSGGAGGGFSYTRSTPSVVPEPSAGLLLLTGLALARVLLKSKDYIA